jgi:hypothetical protein
MLPLADQFVMRPTVIAGEKGKDDFIWNRIRMIDRMWRPLSRTRRTGGEFGQRIHRARREGAWRGIQEAKLFRLALGKEADRWKAMDWLNTAVDEGRAELVAQHATQLEIEAWDMACRIAFLLELV